MGAPSTRNVVGLACAGGIVFLVAAFAFYVFCGSFRKPKFESVKGVAAKPTSSEFEPYHPRPTVGSMKFDVGPIDQA